MNNLGNLIAMKAQEKGLELIFNTNPNVPRVLIGDPLRLGQILLNLAGNAIKFTEHGGNYDIRICQNNNRQQG